MVLIIKKFSYFIAITIIISNLFFNYSCYAENDNIGKINLGLALMLHPKMSLFDYNRLGFYKVEPDLSDDEFEREIERLRTNTPDKKEEISAIKSKISRLRNQPYDAEKEKYIESEINRLEEQIDSIEANLNNYDITNSSETQKILLNIQKEVIDTIKIVANENNLSIIFNDTVPYHNIFPSLFEDRSIFRDFGVNTGYKPYYSFLSSSIIGNAMPSSISLSNWLEFAREPKLMDYLPLNSQPFVLDGAKDILQEVIKKIYSNYNIDDEVHKNIESVLYELSNHTLDSAY